MSVKVQAAPTDPRSIEDIDGALSFLSDSLKVVSDKSKQMYLGRIDKLLDDRNRITNSQSE